MRFNIDEELRCKKYLENKKRKCKMPAIIDGFCVIHYHNDKKDKLQSDDEM